MIQYLLNSTCIWGVSLIFYFLFLRNETFFQWNRLYLVGTCILGSVVSFYSFKAPLPAAHDSSLKYFSRIVSAKEEMVQPAIANSITIGTETILWLIYITGCLVTLFFYCRELIKVYMMYRQGNIYNFQQWKVIETNQMHTPFSWKHLLFISKRENYSADEFDIISKHENVHFRRFHYADIFLLSLLQIVFWFNPLVYMYKYLVKLNHEFEADSYKTHNTEIYGQFLIEQAIGNFQPAMLHTFSSSPLKNRILMLTQKKSNRLKTIKYLAIVPLLLFSFVMVTYAQKKLPVRKDLGNGKFEYLGNVFERTLQAENAQKETLVMTTKAGETISIAIPPSEAFPDKINGKKIYSPADKKCSMPVLGRKGEQLSVYLFNHFKSDFEKLPDNEYEIKTEQFIIDAKGKVAMIQLLEIGGSSVTNLRKLTSRKIISDETKVILEKLSEKMKLHMLYQTSFSPGRINGADAVPACYWEDGRETNKIVVKSGRAIIIKNTD